MRLYLTLANITRRVNLGDYNGLDPVTDVNNWFTEVRYSEILLYYVYVSA